MTPTYHYIATELGRDTYSKRTFRLKHLLKLNLYVMDVLMDNPEDTLLGVKGITNRVREKYYGASESDITTTLETLIKEGVVARLKEA